MAPLSAWVPPVPVPATAPSTYSARAPPVRTRVNTTWCQAPLFSRPPSTTIEVGAQPGDDPAVRAQREPVVVGGARQVGARPGRRPAVHDASGADALRGLEPELDREVVGRRAGGRHVLVDAVQLHGGVGVARDRTGYAEGRRVRVGAGVAALGVDGRGAAAPRPAATSSPVRPCPRRRWRTTGSPSPRCCRRRWPGCRRCPRRRTGTCSRCRSSRRSRCRTPARSGSCRGDGRERAVGCRRCRRSAVADAAAGAGCPMPEPASVPWVSVTLTVVLVVVPLR